MKIISTILASILVSFTALDATASRNLDYQAGGQYTAVFNRSNSQWHMVPRVQHDFTTQQNSNCSSNITVPTGLWLLTHDADGRPELLAPSYTELPEGHSGHIPIIPCSEKPSEGLAVPAKIIDWLTENTGAIYVE